MRIGRVTMLAGLMLASSAVSLKAAAFDNTLTGLSGDIYAALDVVSRELIGMIPAVTRDANVSRAAKGQTITYGVTPVANVVDITPAMTVPEPDDQTIAPNTMSISKSRAAEFGWVGEQQLQLNNNGVGYLTVQGDQIAQALRKLTNEIELDLITAAKNAAARAVGTPGTMPFATIKDSDADLRKVLDDNGAPPSERSAIIDTSTGASMRKLGQLTKVNESGTMMTLRDGELINLSGLSFKESGAFGQLAKFTKGTNASGTTNTAGYAIGATTITLASAGTGTFIAGDVVTFAGDTNQYLLTAGDTDVSNGGTIVLAAPGLMQAIPTSATAITTVASRYIAGVAFPRTAMVLASRAPAVPVEGDNAADRLTIQDPRSGLVFEFSIWKGYRKVRYEVAMAWGVKAAKAEHIAELIR